MESAYLIITIAIVASVIILICILTQWVLSRQRLQRIGQQIADLFQFNQHWQVRSEEKDRFNSELRDNIWRLLQEQQQHYHQQRTQFDQHQIHSLKTLQDTLDRPTALSPIMPHEPFPFAAASAEGKVGVWCLGTIHTRISVLPSYLRSPRACHNHNGADNPDR